MTTLKGVIVTFLGVCAVFVFASQTFADEENILEEQKKIDNYLFEDHADEMEDRGIFVTHTRPFDDTIEIGISPYTNEHADYLYEVFGKETVSVVEGEEATTFSTDETESTVAPVAKEEESYNYSSLLVYFIIGLIGIGGGILLIKKKKSAA